MNINSETIAPRILLVEDNPADVRLVREALRSHSIKSDLQVVSDGDEALRFLLELQPHGERPTPDLVLLDINLPRRSGLEVLREFRERRAAFNLPVIIVTSSTLPDDCSEANKLGVRSYFRKPARLDEFMELGRVVREFMAPETPA